MFEPSARIQVSVIRQRRGVTRMQRIDSGAKSFRNTCRENLRQYLVNTTLHGLKYVGDNTITLFER